MGDGIILVAVDEVAGFSKVLMERPGLMDLLVGLGEVGVLLGVLVLEGRLTLFTSL